MTPVRISPCLNAATNLHPHDVIQKPFGGCEASCELSLSESEQPPDFEAYPCKDPPKHNPHKQNLQAFLCAVLWFEHKSDMHDDSPVCEGWGSLGVHTDSSTSLICGLLM